MNKKNAARNALFTSVVSLLLCVSMLVGTTFAWFTDEVVSGMNTIAAGNLDVELLANGVEVKSDTKLFNLVDAQGNDTWWEPGVVVYENLQVRNVGTLALKYQMALNFGNENDLKGHKLSEVLKVAVLDQTIDESTMTRADVLELAKAAMPTDLGDFALAGELEAETDSPAFAVVIFWEPNDNATDNLYNANNGQETSDKQPLRIEFGVNLLAAQKMSEEDSFGDDYDENATYTVRVSSTEEFIAVLSDIRDRAKQQISGANGDKSYRENVDIVLESDILIEDDAAFMYTDGNGAAFHFYGIRGVLDLNGHNITVSSDALLEGKTYANAALLFQYSNVDIIGDGSIVTENQSSPVYGWANGTVNIYGGTYISNGYERSVSDIYVNNASMVINVYGGNFDSSVYAFNSHDNCGNTPVIVLHEGVTYKQFLKNGTTDVIASDINAGRIVFADGCAPEENVINGETWYQVVKE